MATTTQVNGKSKPTAAKGRNNTLGGFQVGKLDRDVMIAYVRAKELAIAIDVEDEQLGVAIAMHHKQNTPASDHVRCDNCQGVSSALDEACPFCGDAGEVDDDAGDEPSASAAPDEEAPTSEPSLPEAPASEPSVDPTSTEQLAVEQAVEADREAASKKKPKKAKAAPAPKPAAPTTEIAVAASAVLETAQTLDAQVLDVKQLVKRVNDSTNDAAEAYWQLGQKLLEINASHSWKLRVDDKGKRKYRSWDAFVSAELGMSLDQSYRAIEIAKEYDSPRVVREIGQTKAAMILRAAPEDRPVLEEQAKAGASVREIREGVKESRETHGAPKQSAQAKAGKKGGEAKATKTEKKSAEKVSMAVFEGTVTVKLYKKPESLRGLEWPPEKRAKALGDQPIGRHELANGLVQNITIIKDKNGELVAKIQTVREE